MVVFAMERRNTILCSGNFDLFRVEAGVSAHHTHHGGSGAGEELELSPQRSTSSGESFNPGNEYKQQLSPSLLLYCNGESQDAVCNNTNVLGLERKRKASISSGLSMCDMDEEIVQENSYHEVASSSGRFEELGVSPTPIHRKPSMKDLELKEWLDELNKDGIFFQKLRNKNPKRKRETGSKFCSRSIFLSFVEIKTKPNGEQVVDCSGILSRACYETWISSRGGRLSHPTESFRKAILAHITCSDNASLPFPPIIEKHLLQLIRRPEVWPCFQNQVHPETGKPIRIGAKGLRCFGYHERKQLNDPPTKKPRVI